VVEAVESALVDGSRGAAVDPDLGIGEHSLEDHAHRAVRPVGWDGEVATVDAFLVRRREVLRQAVARPNLHAVVVRAESLHFPARGNGDRRPDAAVSPGGAEEIPAHGIIRAAAGEVLDFRGGAAAEARGEDEESENAENVHGQE
jgi:hypothetical protein